MISIPTFDGGWRGSRPGATLDIRGDIEAGSDLGNNNGRREGEIEAESNGRHEEDNSTVGTVGWEDGGHDRDSRNLSKEREKRKVGTGGEQQHNEQGGHRTVGTSAREGRREKENDGG